MSAWLWVALGGAAGSVARHALNGFVSRHVDGAFPWGIFVVNVLGCLAMGVVAAVLLKVGSLADTGRLLLAVGFLGGFTTFSAFALDALRLVQAGQVGLATTYVFGSVLLSLLAVFCGLSFMRWVLA